ncbi:hypothetical protein Syun_024320 [Stephania yunnanensis]|uniref:Glycoside hydrolase family 5 domain-containing protein n=1 Tax=Stephania yunnanensis TaxID=152371 RepID=A0AAP0NII8_9MAGN
MRLHTDSRWIVDESGNRVKLACVNWPSHLQPVLAEGLNKRPLDGIAKEIVEMGFNCVRLTWPLYLATNDSFSSLTVQQSFHNLGLNDSLAGIALNNPSITNLTLIQAYQWVVRKLGENNVMVILDNHLSVPGWCCSGSDGNGFFGDEYFDPEQWLEGLAKMATLFNNTQNVVGMSLRNELRGPGQNVPTWFKYMQEGAERVHSANPNVLTILSGLSFDNDLGFLGNRPVSLTYNGKLVFELHWYGFSDGSAWASGNPNQVCRNVVNSLKGRALFLLSHGWPLFVSEFGIDETGSNENDNRYSNCMFGLMAELDLDWAVWGLQGSYYLRQGTVELDETFGVLSFDWSRPRNKTFLQRLQAIQPPFQGPGVTKVNPYDIMFHPLSGLCVITTSEAQPQLVLGSCLDAEAWAYNKSQQTSTLTSINTELCVQAQGPGEPVTLSKVCSSSSASWEIVSMSRMQLSSRLADSTSVCLDVGANAAIVAKPCECPNDDDDHTCDPANQWFKMVNSTRSSKSASVFKRREEILQELM